MKEAIISGYSQENTEVKI